MVLLPRVNAQNTKSGQEQHRLRWAVLYMMYFFIYAVRNVCGLVVVREGRPRSTRRQPAIITQQLHQQQASNQERREEWRGKREKG